MKDHSISTLSTNTATTSKMNTLSTISKNRSNKSNILELHYNDDLKDFLKVTEFKEFKLNQKQEYAKIDDSDLNILCIEDLDLRDALKAKEFDEKDFNIVNKFLRIEEEELINKKNNDLNNKRNNDGKDNNIRDNTENDDEDFVLNQINNKLFKDDEFQTGLFTSFDFKDRIQSLINNSFNFNSNNMTVLNKMSDKNSTESNNSEAERKITSEINDSFILDTCFADKDITYDNIVINFDKDTKKEKKYSSVSDEKKSEFEFLKKKEAIPEYENQIISYQNLNYVEKQKDIEIFPEKEEPFDKKLYEYFNKVAKEIKNEELKNKVKLVLKLVSYKDLKTKKFIFDNNTKNKLLNYWKDKYQKELNEATFREKSKILQEKLDNANPNNRLTEISKKFAETKKKANLRKKPFSRYKGQKSSSNIFSNFRAADKKGIFKFTSINLAKTNFAPKNYSRRRFSIDNNSLNIK